MKRDHILFLVIGVLVGFIAGYLLQEVMVLRQPPRLAPGTGSAAAPAGGAGQPGAPAVDPQAQMQAVQQLRAYVEENPDDAQAVLQLANLNFDIQEWRGAAQLYERYLELEPGHPDVLSDLGTAYRGMGQFDRALETFDQAQEIAPAHWQSRFNEAIVLAFDLGELDRAAEVVDELERLQPGNPRVAELSDLIERQRGAA